MVQHRFWKTLINEYLPHLCRRIKRHRLSDPLSIGDIVLVRDGSERSKWPMGRVIRTFLGKDQQVRLAEVQTKSGIIRRPACILAKIDISKSNLKYCRDFRISC